MNQFHYIRFSLQLISLLSIIIAFPTYAQTATRVLNLQSPVRSIALSPNGKTLVCGTADNRVSIWDVSTGKLKLSIMAHHSELSCVAFSPDGRFVASAGRRDYMKRNSTTSTTSEVLESLEVKIWDAQTLDLKKTLNCYGFALPYIAFSPDSKILATAIQSNWGIQRDGLILLWNVETGQREQILDHDLSLEKTYIPSIAFSADAKTLAAATWQGVVLWDLQLNKVRRILSGHHGFVGSVVFSPDGKKVISGGWDGKINLWDVNTGKLEKTFAGRAFWAQAAIFTANGKFIAVGGSAGNGLGPASKGSIELWNVQNGTLEKTLIGHRKVVNALAFSLDNKTLVSGSSDSKVRLWHLPRLQ
jgi:WD40 repeat protein